LLQELLEFANPDQVQADYSVRQLLDDFSAGLGNQLAAQPEVEAEVRLTIGRAYRRLSVADRAESNLKMALDLSRRVFGAEHEKVAECLIDYGWYLIMQKRGVEAEKAIREALRIYRLRDMRGKAYVKGLRILQHALVTAGRNAESVAVTQEALAVADASPGVEFADLANILHRHADVLFGQQQYATSEDWARRSVEMHRRLHGHEHPETGYGLRTLAHALQAQGKLAEAESAQREAIAIFRKRFGDACATTTGTINELKQMLKAQGKTSELEAVTRE
jgi:tetratricopeptide (TPR) repeat protein